MPSHVTPKTVRRLLAVVFVLLVLGYFFASPYLALRSLRAAVMAGDAERLERAVDFPNVRAYLKEDLRAKMTAWEAKQRQEQRSKADQGAMAEFAQGIANFLGPAIADHLVDAHVTAAGIVELSRNGWQLADANAATAGSPGPAASPPAAPKAIREDFRLQSGRFLSPTEFQAQLQGGARLRLELGATGWKLRRVSLPENIFETAAAPGGMPDAAGSSRPNSAATGAKTAPTPDPNEPPAGGMAAVCAYLAEHWTEEGESWFANYQEEPGFSFNPEAARRRAPVHRREMRKVTLRPHRTELTEADRLNGLEWKGMVSVEPAAYRDTDAAGNFGEWKDAKELGRMFGESGLYLSIESRGGQWSIEANREFTKVPAAPAPSPDLSREETPLTPTPTRPIIAVVPEPTAPAAVRVLPATPVVEIPRAAPVDDALPAPRLPEKSWDRPHLYLQLANETQRRAALEVKSRLVKAGYVVAGVEAVPGNPSVPNGASTLRYFTPADGDEAR